MANPFVHIELSTTDLPKAKAFYGQLFGWKLTDNQMDQGTYTLVDVGDGVGGGMMQQMMPGAGSAWLAYVAVDDLAASTSKTRELGAHVMMDSMEVPNMGTFSIFTDPTGAMLALWQPKTP